LAQAISTKYCNLICFKMMQAHGAIVFSVLMCFCNTGGGALRLNHQQKDTELVLAGPYPIGYSIPDEIFKAYRPLRERKKSRLFAPYIPGSSHAADYSFSTEESYYEQYGTAMFGITQEKGGWDCLRHYEIIAAGAIPYFLDMENMPENTMTHFPKMLVRQAMQLRGMPSEEHVTKMLRTREGQEELEVVMNDIDKVEYNIIRDKLLNFAEEQLLGSRMYASVVPKGGARIYMHTAPGCPQGYLRALMAMGLMANGNQVFLDPPLAEMFDDCDKGKATALYGRGYSYTCRTPQVNHIKEISNDTKWDYYILNAECNWGFPKLHEDVLHMAGHLIAVEGADEGGQKLETLPPGVDKYYVRESL